MDEKWIELLDKVDYAFQPIVNIHSGRVYALEALIRNYESQYFHTIDSVFDIAFSENVLYKLDMKLREIALKKFTSYEFASDIKLFYNLDNRITRMPDFVTGKTTNIIKKYGMDNSNLCFELSEKHQAGALAGFDNLILNMYKQQGYKMAIDDFGIGFSGFQMLYRSEPDFIKIDRFFITDIDQNKKKQLFVSSIVEIAQAMGVFIIAEGVETFSEYEECRRLGCNMVQGYFVARPTRVLDELSLIYPKISQLHAKDKRCSNEIKNIHYYLQPLPYIEDDSNLDDVFEYFRKNLDLTLAPVVSNDMNPLGIIKEVDLKEYIYSQYGLSILKNQSRGNFKKFITKCGVADINDSFEKILKVYSYNSNNGGVIITENKKYLGYLSAKIILDIINEKSLLDAKDQNPLSGLPGNKTIEKYIANSVTSRKKCVMVYFDFDNFKPFNDHYGFRNGDRVISLFANILKKHSSLKDSLIGHIGGDDFFLGLCDVQEGDEDIYLKILNIVNQFGYEVESFYDEKDRNQGYIYSKGRNDIDQSFPMMTVSAAVLSVGEDLVSCEECISVELSKLKKSAKKMPHHIAWASLIG